MEIEQAKRLLEEKYAYVESESLHLNDLIEGDVKIYVEQLESHIMYLYEKVLSLDPCDDFIQALKVLQQDTIDRNHGE